VADAGDRLQQSKERALGGVGEAEKL